MPQNNPVCLILPKGLSYTPGQNNTTTTAAAAAALDGLVSALGKVPYLTNLTSERVTALCHANTLC